MSYASVQSWEIRNTMKAGRRHGRSTRPALEAMEGRTLLTGLMYANSASVVEHGTGPVTMQFTIDLTSATDASGDCQLPDIELDGDCRHGLHRRCWDAHHSGGSDIRSNPGDSAR